MTYTAHYDSPLGGIRLTADEVGLTGSRFDDGRHFAVEPSKRDIPALVKAKRWLDIYFSGREPDFLPPLHPVGSAFRHDVWALLLQIPYGRIVTYGEIARRLAETRGPDRLSAQAVGGAVGHNELFIFIPCHRVVGANGSLTGYAGGIDKKRSLLAHEHADMSRFFRFPPDGIK